MKRINRPINVLITAMGGGGHGEQILKALKQVDHDDYVIFGADANENCPQFKMVKKSFVLPKASDPDYLATVLDICKQYDIQALFHGCEPELKLFSKNREKIEGEGIFLPINPQKVIDICMDKLKTAEFLKKIGFHPPEFVSVKNKDDIENIDFYPVVIKPSIGGGGSANCYIAQNSKQLFALSDYLGLDDEKQEFIIQEYVGTPEEEYTVGVLHDMDGHFINSIGIRRELKSMLNVRLTVQNKTNKKELGHNLVISSGVSHGYVDKFEEVTSQCEQIAKALGVKGAVNVQCRFVKGKIKVFEINPRFSGTTSIRAMMGYNEPDVLMRKHLLGENIPRHFEYESGLVLRSLIEQQIR